MKHHQITASMAKDIAFKLGAELNNEEAEIFSDGYNAAMQSFVITERLNQARVKQPSNAEQVADLYALCWKPGDVVTYTPDPEKATIWLNNYSGTCVQEYVKLERFQGVASDNSPVMPDGYALVPVEPTDEMIAAAMNCEDVLFNSDESFCVQFGNIYEAMLAAAPQK